MASNGIVKFLTSAKAIIAILGVLVALVVWFSTMGNDVQIIKAENARQNESSEELRHCVTANTKTLVKVETRLEAVDEKVERNYLRQEVIRKEITDRLDSIYDKVK